MLKKIMLSEEIEAETQLGFHDALEGKDRNLNPVNLSAYTYGFFKGLDAAKFLGVKNQHTEKEEKAQIEK